tara:strand:- start:274 stop:1596 length:1323 start_codon:yes stop_codon:yes gene_type:complete
MTSKIIKSSQINILSILFALLPALLVSGPLLSEICIIFLILALLYFRIFNLRNLDLFKFSSYFFVFYLSINISSFFSPDIFLSFKSSLTYIRFYLFILVIFFLITFNQKTLIYFKVSLSIIFILLLADSTLQFLIGKNILGFELLRPNNVPRVSSLFGDELIMGSFIVRFLPILLGLILLTENDIIKKKIYFFSALFFSSYLIFISGERLAFVYLIIIFLIFFLFLSFGKLLKVGILVTIIFSIIVVINFYPNMRIIETTKKQITNLVQIDNKFIKEKKFHFISDQHMAHVSTAYKIFKDNPIFGTGIKSFRYVCNDKKYKTNVKKVVSEYGNEVEYDACSTHPHNTYMQLLSETGLVPTILILIIFIGSIYKIIKISFRSNNDQNKTNNVRDFQILILTSIIINFFPLLPSGNFYNNWLSIVYSIPIGIYLGTMKNLKV